MLMLGLFVLLALAITGAGWGHSRLGLAGWSPVAVILAVVMVLWLSGHTHW
jgi:hypothetical protein